MTWTCLEHPLISSWFSEHCCFDKDRMNKGAFTFYCQLRGLGTVPHDDMYWSKKQLPIESRKSRNISHGEILKLTSSRSIHLPLEQAETHKTKIRARNCEKKRQTQCLDASPESVQMFRTDSGLGYAANFHSHKKQIYQLQHSNNSSFLLPELLSQLSHFPVQWASLALLSSSLLCSLI